MADGSRKDWSRPPVRPSHRPSEVRAEEDSRWFAAAVAARRASELRRWWRWGWSSKRDLPAAAGRVCTREHVTGPSAGACAHAST
eukprot:378134-Prymnesium_polylepis.1